VGQLFCYTTNPPEATADGLAMAARAGARLEDLEFVQFHPTALATGADPLPLLTEALRGVGAVLVNSAGERFMCHEHDAAELAPRDVVARGIWRQLQRGQQVFLDGRTAIGPSFPVRFPTVFAHCQQHGLDPRRDLLPVAPAAHYHMGGVAVDLHGRTSLARLWACGEVACTGVHGANRLASNSLLEALVFGRRVGADVQRHLPCRPDARLVQRLTQYRGQHRRPLPPAAEQALRQSLRQLMWEHVGLARTEAGLIEALQELRQLEARYRPTCGEVRHLLRVAHLMTTAALLRRESRGAHYRADYPASDPDWERHSLWTAVELEAAQCGLAPEKIGVRVRKLTTAP
jgi:L-aspartate oxidase